MTAELAILMPAVVLMLVAVLSAGTAAVAQLRCVDAARTGARLAARSEPGAEVREAVQTEAPARARVEIATAGRLVTVRVGAQVQLPLPGRPSLGVRATSTARLETAP